MKTLTKLALVGLVGYSLCRGYDPERARRMDIEQTTRPQQYVQTIAEAESLVAAKDVLVADIDADKNGTPERYRIFVGPYGAVAYSDPHPMHEHVARNNAGFNELEKKLQEKYPEKKMY